MFRHNRSLPLLFAWTAVLAVVWALLAGQSSNYGVGRPPTAEEVRAWDIAIGPDGDELPIGEGTAPSATIHLPSGRIPTSFNSRDNSTPVHSLQLAVP